MSERDNFCPPDQLSDDELPQSIPRAGLGIANENYIERDSAKEEDETDLPDLATIPELAPLALSDDRSTPVALEGDSGGFPPNGQYRYPDEEDDDDDYKGVEKEEAPTEAQDLFSHLGELRNRILYSVYGIFAASILTWNYGQEISEWFARPVRRVLATESKQFKLVTLDPTEGFQTYLQITLVAAILLSMPWIIFQLWRFLEPALTKTERKFSIILLPFSVVLFFTGCALGYIMSPLFFKFFMMFQPPGSEANFGYGVTIALLAKMILCFGICFQVPIVTIFLNKIGLVSRNFLIDYWRHAVIVIFVVVAVITPTWDPLSLAVCAVPPCVLYGVSIWMVKWL